MLVAALEKKIFFFLVITMFAGALLVARNKCIIKACLFGSHEEVVSRKESVLLVTSNNTEHF